MFNTSLIPKDISDIGIERNTEISMNSKITSDTNSVEVSADGHGTADDVVLLKHSRKAVMFLNIFGSFKGNVSFLIHFQQSM